MKETQDLLVQEQWRVIDQSSSALYTSALQSFGMDDTLCASVGAGMVPATARAWVHQNTIQSCLSLKKAYSIWRKRAMTLLCEILAD